MWSFTSAVPVRKAYRKNGMALQIIVFNKTLDQETAWDLRFESDVRPVSIKREHFQ
jgi:hypothetical protein